MVGGQETPPELPPIFQMQIDGEVTQKSLNQFLRFLFITLQLEKNDLFFLFLFQDDAKSCIRNMPRMFVTFKS